MENFTDPAAASPAPPASPQPGVASRLRDAVRIAFFLRVPEQRLRPGALEVVAAVLLTLCVPTLYNAAIFGADGRFGMWEVSQALFHIPMILIAASVAARLARRDDAIATLLFATLIAWFVVDVATWVAWMGVESTNLGGKRGVAPMVFYYAPIAWLSLAAARFAMTLEPQGVLRRIGILAAYAVVVALPIGYLHPERSLWVKDWAKDAARNSRTGREVASEEAIYKQPQLLARELAAVEPRRNGVVNVFFVGMAGYGSQDVFMREVDSVAKLMRERFGADGHIVKLENNPKSVLTNPIASTTSLRATLKRFTETMDVEKDVLVLYLTSHGSAEHEFSLQLWPIEFNKLNPATLRAILDESGIRNRVVVISACYSGGFVDKLRDERTLVITAAAADKTSFGCDNVSQWTYFGRAYFDEALRKTYSFTEAFDIAKPLVAEREKAQNFDPSQPQMAAGSTIVAKLAELQAQLEKGPAAVPTQTASPTATGDIFIRYIDFTFDARYAAQMKETCLNSMNVSSPERWLDKDPLAYGGLDKSSPLWPRLVLAWQRYSDEYCAAANDPALTRSVYEQSVRASMTEKDISPVMQFLAGGVGKRWYEKEREATLDQTRRLVKITETLSDAGYRRYLDEQAKVFAEFRKETEGPAKH